jgi:hypothetical protein
MAERDLVECRQHGKAFETFVCRHLALAPRQRWHSGPVTDEDPWPDAWCDRCDEAFQRHGEWTPTNSEGLQAVLLCHECYESARSRGIG